MTETKILIRLLAHRATYLSQFLYPIVFYCIGQCVVVISRLTMRPGLARPCRGRAMQGWTGYNRDFHTARSVLICDGRLRACAGRRTVGPFLQIGVSSRQALLPRAHEALNAAG